VRLWSNRAESGAVAVAVSLPSSSSLVIPTRFHPLKRRNAMRCLLSAGCEVLVRHDINRFGERATTSSSPSNQPTLLQLSADLQEVVKGHKVVAYPSPRGANTESPTFSRPARSHSAARTSAPRGKDLVQDVYDRMGLSYDSETGVVDLTQEARPGRSREVEEGSDRRARSLSRGRLAAIWPPQASVPPTADSEPSFSPKASPTKASQQVVPGCASHSTTPISSKTHNMGLMGSPAYCKDMMTFMPDAADAPMETLSSHDDVSQVTEQDNALADRRLSIKDRIHSFEGSNRDLYTKGRSSTPGVAGSRFAGGIAAGMGMIASAPSSPQKSIHNSKPPKHHHLKSGLSDFAFDAKNDDEKKEEDARNSDTMSVSSASSYNKAVPTMPRFIQHPSSPTRSFPGHRVSAVDATTTTYGRASSTADNPTQRRPIPLHKPSAVYASNRVSLQETNGQSTFHPNSLELEKMIDDRVQARIQGMEIRLEAQLTLFMNHMDQRMGLMQEQMKEMHMALLCEDDGDFGN
jgi:hypothetical protein